MTARQPSRDVRDELQQTAPFRSRSQEALLSLVRTSSVLSRRIGRVIEPHGLSLQQYNVLRILRGAGTDGLPTLCIRDRMIEEGSTITRLIDKLERAGLAERKRSSPDRRQVLCFLTDHGRNLLLKLDPLVQSAEDATMAALSPEQQHTLIALLGTLRVEAAAEAEAE